MLVQSPDGCLLFDNTVLDKNYSSGISGSFGISGVCLKNLAYQTHQTVYQIKKGLLSDYLRQQLKQPTISFT